MNSRSIRNAEPGAQEAGTARAAQDCSDGHCLWLHSLYFNISATWNGTSVQLILIAGHLHKKSQKD